MNARLECAEIALKLRVFEPGYEISCSRGEKGGKVLSRDYTTTFGKNTTEGAISNHSSPLATRPHPRTLACTSTSKIYYASSN